MSFSNKGFSLYLTLMLETVDTVIFFFFFLHEPCDMWDLSSLTRDQTQAPCSGSIKF